MSDQPDWICAVCDSALDVCLDGSGSSLQHPLAAAADHEPHPVRPGPDWRGRCDFCTEGVPTFAVPASDFRAPGFDTRHSRGAWSACDMCALLIESNRWNSLIERALNTHRELHGEVGLEQVRTALNRLYRELRKAINGSLRRLGGAE